MALILKDRVKESSSSSGTGNITLGGAFPGYQTFNAAVATGSTVYYTIHNLAAGFDTEWEVGVGTFTSPATLARNTVLSSSTGSLINFTAGSNGLEVFITQPAEEAVYINNATGKVEANGNGANTISFTNINASNVVMVSGTITTNAANATDITNKAYVDGLVAAGIHFHEPVLVESPTALIATYNQPGGAGNGVGATLTNSGANVALSIDGVSLSNTARVLVYTQSNAVQNGVYTVTNPGAPDAPGPGAAWVLTRATDADTYVIDSPTGLSEGSTFFVQSGNTGAGETYTCNTTGTITFGTTDITFAQISSAQIYSAGTGLSLTNTTFSIANTAVTANTYGNDGAVGQFTVNAQGQITNAATVSVNASAISLGTLANARTTADSANGASTIVSRDANGSFAANVITATTSNATTVNATTGNFTNITGNAVSLTDINASNITSGTISNARTTASDANSASTIVVRDANGAFAAGNVTAANFIGAGTTITSINASNISSGTIDNSRTTAASANGASTIVLRDAGGNFTANTITANIAGDISGGTNINASNITSGTINNARTTASSANGASTIVLRDVNGSFDANVVNATNLSGGGTLITSMNASNLSAGTVPVARVSGSYTGITGVGTVTAGTWQGNVIATTYGGTNLSSFTANGVVYASSTTALATGSGFVYDGTNVGIGLSNPSQKLEVTGNIKINGGVVAGERGNAAAPAFSFSDDLDTGMFNVSNLDLGFSTQGTERMRIDSSGNVGIGTTSPVANRKLTISNTGQVAAMRINAPTGYDSFIEFTENNSLTANQYWQINKTTSTHALQFWNGSERMRIDSAGNVGIGTASPSGKLNVSDATLSQININSGATGAARQILFSTATNTQEALISANNSTGELKFESGRSGSSAYFQTFYTNNTERMRVSPNGNLLLGVTSDSGLTAGGDFALKNGASIRFRNAADSAYLSMINVDSSNNLNFGVGGVPANITFGVSGIGEVGRFPSGGGFSVGTTSSPGSGAIYATGNITAFFSDQRLKTVSGKIENALDKVKSLSGVYYTMNDVAKANGYDSDETQVGVLAQEVEAVLPEIVKPAPFDLDENNNSKSGENYKTVQYEKLVPLLIEAIKELEAQVAELKAR